MLQVHNFGSVSLGMHASAHDLCVRSTFFRAKSIIGRFGYAVVPERVYPIYGRVQLVDVTKHSVTIAGSFNKVADLLRDCLRQSL